MNLLFSTRLLMSVKTNLMSNSGCCFLIARCFLASFCNNRPLVSMMIPLGRMKSGVYLHSNTYLMISLSYLKGTLRCSRLLATLNSNLDLKPCKALEVSVVLIGKDFFLLWFCAFDIHLHLVSVLYAEHIVTTRVTMILDERENLYST